MKYFFGIFFLSFCLSHLSAQEKHFVFIQSENKQPFYVSVNGKLYSSTASGYVIIPKLTDGNYNFTVGFAQNTYPEQTFLLAIQNKDLGYDLKNFNEKGWGLFNLQTLDITMASTGNTDVVAKALSESANAKADDGVISFNKKKEPVPTTLKPADTSVTVADAGDAQATPVKVDSSVAVNQTPATDAAPTSNQATKPDQSVATNNVDVKKVSEVSGSEGVQLSYTEGSGKNKDTIHIIIPSSPVAANATASATSATTDNSKNTALASNQATAVASAGSGNKDLKFLDINMGSKKDAAKVPSATTGTSRVMENSNCKNVATEDDYWKLRKRMSMQTSDEKMISEAKKVYRVRCFTTSQIKALSTLFLSDEGRYKFFDASFVSVADATQYYTLQSEFIDPAFVTRFKALLQ